jgi:predicted nuclease of predicted toxin-antitoxin system
VPFIQDLHPYSTQVALIGLEQADDTAIRQYAIDNGFVIVSKDVDFCEMNSLYAMARTILNEVLGVKIDFIEHQLAHAVKDPQRRSLQSDGAPIRAP